MMKPVSMSLCEQKSYKQTMEKAAAMFCDLQVINNEPVTGTGLILFCLPVAGRILTLWVCNCVFLLSAAGKIVFFKIENKAKIYQTRQYEKEETIGRHVLPEKTTN